MFCSTGLPLTVVFSLALLTMPGLPGQSRAQSDSPATKQSGDATLASAPNFSAAGMTTKVVSISKAGNQIALALMFQNTNTYPVRSAIVTGSFTVVDNKGQFVRAAAVSGMQMCGTGRSTEQLTATCIEPKNFKESAYLVIDPGASVIVNMALSGSALGDTVTLSGMLAVLPMAVEAGTSPDAGLSVKATQPSKGRVINISIPLIPLQ